MKKKIPSNIQVHSTTQNTTFKFKIDGSLTSLSQTLFAFTSLDRGGVETRAAAATVVAE